MKESEEKVSSGRFERLHVLMDFQSKVYKKNFNNEWMNHKCEKIRGDYSSCSGNKDRSLMEVAGISATSLKRNKIDSDESQEEVYRKVRVKKDSQIIFKENKESCDTSKQSVEKPSASKTSFDIGNHKPIEVPNTFFNDITNKKSFSSSFKVSKSKCNKSNFFKQSSPQELAVGCDPKFSSELHEEDSLRVKLPSSTSKQTFTFQQDSVSVEEPSYESIDSNSSSFIRENSSLFDESLLQMCVATSMVKEDNILHPSEIPCKESTSPPFNNIIKNYYIQMVLHESKSALETLLNHEKTSLQSIPLTESLVNHLERVKSIVQKELDKKTIKSNINLEEIIKAANEMIKNKWQLPSFLSIVNKHF